MSRPRMLPPKAPRRSAGLQRSASRTAFPLFHLLLVALLLCAATASQSFAQNISTVAGNGGGGFSGDGGPATSAMLQYPYGTSLDANGNIYIADSYNHRIRKVTVATGKISTVAGNGTQGFSGDGGLATSAQLNGPTHMVVDASGNVYICDINNNRLRKVDTSGIITTVTSEINGLHHVGLDASGNLYFTETFTHRIRKIVLSTGIISTVAGTGVAGFSGDGGLATSAQLNTCAGLSVEANGDLYIGDLNNNRIRKVTATTGNISTVAGNGTQGFSGDGGPATSAQLNYAFQVALDAAGNLYIADFFNHRIRKVTAATGNISTVAGTGVAGFSGDAGPAISAQLNAPIDVALDVAGNFYIADYGNHRIRKVAVAPELTTTTLASDVNPSVSGQSVTFTATVSSGAGTPSGSVTFSDGATDLGTGTLDGSGRASISTSALGVGDHSITVAYAGDGNFAASTSAVLTQNVVSPNQPPVAVADAVTTDEDTPVTVDVRANDSDPDGDDLTVTDATQGTNGAVVANSDQTLTYTPNPDFNGSDSFTYTLSDGQGGTATAEVAVTVIPVNDAPSFTLASIETKFPPEEDAGEQTMPGTAFGIIAGPADESGQSVTFEVTNDNHALFSVQPAISSDGTLTYTSAPDANGSATVAVRAHDDGGTANGGVDASALQPFVITVSAVNDPPSFTKGADQVVAEDAGEQTLAHWATAISAGPADEAGQALSFSVSSDNEGLFQDQPAISPDGTLVFAPTANASGTATVTVTLQDDGPGADGGGKQPPMKGGGKGGADASSASQTFTITVDPVNDPPVLAEVAPQSLSEGQLLTFAVTATDPDGPVTLSMAGAPAGASLEDPHDGTATFAWTPGYDQAGTYAVNLIASDGSLSDTKSVAITVTNVTRTITATAGANGTITPDGETTVDHSSSQTFTIAAGAGYRIEDVLVDGASVGAVETYTFSNVTENHTISASFAINTYTITASAGAGGSISPLGETTINYGADQAYTIAPVTGYHIADVLVDGVSVGAVETYTFSNVTANQTISASFAINTYTLTATAGANGTISPAGASIVTYGGSQAYTIAPVTGYHIADVLVDNASVGAVANHTFTNVTANHTLSASFVDVTPPVLTLNGANPLLLELGTTYPEPGATASDLADGDLSGQIQVSGSVDPSTEGSYTLTYTVSDAAHNSASASRTVQVVVTPNSYGLIATHSMHLRQNARINSGFAGVVNQGQRPFLAGKVELVVGTRVQTAEGVRLSAPRVQVRQNARIDGQLLYNQLVSVGKKATIAQQTQVPASYFPLFQGFGLPAFQAGTPGSQDVEVRQKASATLSAGAYDEIEVKQKGTLTFSGGTYSLRSLEVGPNAKVLFLAPTTLLIQEEFALDHGATFGPTSGVSAAQVLVYVEGRNGRPSSDDGDNEGDDEEDDSEGRQMRSSPKVAKIGVNASFQGNLYAPNGTIHLRQGSLAVGSFIGKDIIVGVRAQVAAQSGWNTPGVSYQPQVPAASAKLAGAPGEAGALPDGTGLLANYPNPFNPSTTVPYVLAEAGLVKLSVYNVLGQQIRVLVDQLQVPGSYSVSWDGMDAAGLQVAGGVYFYRLQAGDHIQVRKMLFAK